MSAAMPNLTVLSAAKQLRLEQDFPNLIPTLTGRGLGLEDAAALAHNTTLLYYAMTPEEPFRSPADVLERLSLRGIADLCELYGRLERGEEEWGVNENFEEAVAWV